MKKIILGLSFIATLLATNVSAEINDGKTIFDAKGCGLCHKPHADTIGPSLRAIWTAYLGKEMSLLSYLKGQGEPIVDPARAAVMNPQLVKIRSLTDEDIKKLAEYVVSATEAQY